MLIAITVSPDLSKQCDNPFIAGCIDPENVAKRLKWELNYNMETSRAVQLTKKYGVVFWSRDESGLSLVAEYTDIKTPGRTEFKRRHTIASDAIGVDLLDFFDPMHRHENTFAINCAGVAIGLLMFALGIAGTGHLVSAEIDYSQLNPFFIVLVVLVESLLQTLSTMQHHANAIMGVENNTLSRAMQAQGFLYTMVETWASHAEQPPAPVTTGIERTKLASLMQTVNKDYIFDWVNFEVDDGWNGDNYYALVPCDPTKSFGQIVVSDHDSICTMYESVTQKVFKSDSEEESGFCLHELNEGLVANEYRCPFNRGIMTAKTYRESGAQWIKLSDISKEVLQPYFPGRQLASFTDVAAHSC